MLPVIGSLIAGAASSIDKLFTSDEERIKATTELQKLQNDLGKAVLDHEKTLIKAQRSILEKELNSGSWIARNWRPLTSLMFGIIIGYNYLLLPLAEFLVGAFKLNFWVPAKEDIPDELWSLLKLSLSGYILGRSGEKIASTLSKK